MSPSGSSRRFRLTGVLTATALAGAAVGFAPPAAAAGGHPPVVVDDRASTISGHAVLVRALANDRDPDGGPLTLRAAALAKGSEGTAKVKVERGVAVRITPGAAFSGRLVVNYAVADNEKKAGYGQIVVTVIPPNHAPGLGADKVTIRSGQVATIRPLANDSDPDGDRLRLVAAASTRPKVVGAKTSGNRLTVWSAASFTGSVVVNYTVADAHGARANGRVLVTVLAPPPNRAPVARPDAATVTAGTTSSIKVLANDRDPDGDRISLVAVGKASKGTARRAGSAIVYTAPGTAGKAVVRYTIKDSHGAAAAGVLTITIKAKPVAKPKPKPPAAPTRAGIEAALRRLGLPTGSVNGVYDGATRRAVCAWRTITGRTARRSLPSAAEARAIIAMKGLPKARSVMVTGVTVSVTCQAAFWVTSKRQYKRVMAACTGKPGYRTRLGTFRVFRSFTTWRYSTIYPEARMYKPMQFSGGQALHGSSTDRLVKTRPRSHGCVRMFHRDIDAMHNGGLGVGTRVRVVGYWKG